MLGIKLYSIHAIQTLQNIALQPGLSLSREKKVKTFIQNIVGNMLNKCTSINPNFPWISRMKNELQHE